jgi:probable HAF family extracellular repeat protein
MRFSEPTARCTALSVLALLIVSAPTPAQVSVGARVGRSAGLPEAIVLDRSVGAPWDGRSPRDVDDQGRVVGRGELDGSSFSYEWTAAGGLSLIQTPYVGVGRINSIGDMIYPLNPLVLIDGTEVLIDNPQGTPQGVSLADVNDSLVVVGSAPGSGTTSEILVWDPAQGSRSYFVHAARGMERVSQENLAVGSAIVNQTGSDGFVLDLATGQATRFNAILPTGPTRWSIAVDVNNNGTVVGEGSDGVGLSAFTWSPQAGFEFLPGLKGGETLRVHPRAIDDRGRVVGQAMIASGEWRAFLWDPRTGMRDLNDLIDAPSGYVLHEARDISETGVVIGWGTFDGSTFPQAGFILPGI